MTAVVFTALWRDMFVWCLCLCVCVVCVCVVVEAFRVPLLRAPAVCSSSWTVRCRPVVRVLNMRARGYVSVRVAVSVFVVCLQIEPTCQVSTYR